MFVFPHTFVSEASFVLIQFIPIGSSVCLLFIVLVGLSGCLLPYEAPLPGTHQLCFCTQQHPGKILSSDPNE